MLIPTVIAKIVVTTAGKTTEKGISHQEHLFYIGDNYMYQGSIFFNLDHVT